MARQLRLEFPNALYHVTSRGNEKRPTFYDDDDRVAFLAFLGEAVRRFGWSVTAWVLMTNHFHLVIQTPEANLSKGMHWLNTKYVGWFNKRHDRSGHLYGGRFKSHLVEKERYIAEVLRYVVLNPVRVKIVERPEDYRWSSYRATAGLAPAEEWLDAAAALNLFASDQDLARCYYREFVEAKIGSTERLWDKAINGIYLGREAWAKRMRKIVESKPRSTDHPRKQRAIARPKMHAVIAAVANVAQTTATAIRSMRGGALRRLAAYAWYGVTPSFFALMNRVHTA